MAEINPFDIEGAQKTVRSQTKKISLILMGVVLVVLIVLLATSWGSITSLFKGFIGEPIEAPVAYECLGGLTQEEYTALSQEDKSACTVEVIINSIDTTLEGKTCPEIDDFFANIEKTMFMSTVVPNEILSLIYQKFEDNNCTAAQGPAISKYTKDELENMADYCIYGNFYLDKENYALLVENASPDYPAINACLPLIFPDTQTENQVAMQLLADQFAQNGLDFSDCDILQTIAENEDGRFRLVSGTQEILEQRIENQCQCPQGPAYKKGSDGVCIYDCEKGRNVIDSGIIEYYTAVQTATAAENRVTKLNEIENNVIQYMPACLPGLNAPAVQGKQEICNAITPYKYAIGVTSEELSLLDSISSQLTCCEESGNALTLDISSLGVPSQTCSVNNDQVALDLDTYSNIYEFATENDTSASQRDLKLKKLIEAADSFNSQYEQNVGILDKVGSKDAICSRTLNILNTGAGLGDIAVGSDDESSLKLLSQNLACCPPPGHYGLTSEVLQGAEPVYACLAEPEAIFERKAGNTCEEKYPEQSQKILDSVADGSDFYLAVAEKDSLKLIGEIRKIEILVLDFGEECNLTTVNSTNLCEITKQTLEKAGYDEKNFNATAKTELSNLFNNVFKCCYYKQLDGTAGETVNVDKPSADQITCEQVTYSTPQFTFTSVEPVSFNPSAEETVRFQFKVDNLANIKVEIFDKNNEKIFQTENTHIFPNAISTIIWNGNTSGGALAEGGAYTYKLTPYNFNPETAEARTGNSSTGELTVLTPETQQPPQGLYSFDILDVNITAADGTECFVGSDCILTAQIAKTGEAAPQSIPSAFVQTDDYSGTNPVEGLEEAGEYTVTYTHPDLVIKNAAEKEYGIQLTILEGADQLKSESFTFTPQAAPLSPPDQTEEENIKILKADADPDQFNPLILESKITYEISKKAVMKLSILDEKGLTVVTLTNDEELGKGEHFVWWNGTDKADSAGTVVPPGTYTYKIIASDPDTDEVQDIKTGEIEAQYEIVTDFENVTPQPVVVAATTDTGQAAATMALQETYEGETAGTGPEALIYLLLPVIGYFASRKTKK
ncbi:MAG: hypothetical protein ABIH78_00840 [Candidatus Peregrinibacteria bacterium]